jgi:hypothetical protein
MENLVVSHTFLQTFKINQLIYWKLVCHTIFLSIWEAKYYSLIFDMTPDNAHIEQMSQIVRYVETQHDSLEIKEAFNDFIPPDVRTAEIITVEITNKPG